MSRKSRLTLNKERLGRICDCPDDIFNSIEPDEDTFAKIEAAAKRDVGAIRELASYLFDVYKQADTANPAVLYYARLGLSLSDAECATVMLKCMDTFNDGFEELDDVCTVIGKAQPNDDTNALLETVKVKKIIRKADTDSDFDAIISQAKDTDNALTPYLRIYLESRRLRHTGNFDKESVIALAESLDIPKIVMLPVFSKDDDEYLIGAKADNANEINAMRYALTLVDMDEWRDFWLRAECEYAQIYLGGNIGHFITDAAFTISERCAYPRKMIHLLALKKYFLDTVGNAEDAEYLALEEKCKFEEHVFNLADESMRDAIIKEAVYTSGREERLKKLHFARLGTVIQHVKNRYSISTTLTNHIKRGSKHVWELTLSIELEDDVVPVISNLKIDTRRHKVIRGGVALDQEKKLSQILCSSVITIDGKVYPLEADLILDIAYVSTTKCDQCEVKIRDTERIGPYLVMDAVLSIY